MGRTNTLRSNLRTAILAASAALQGCYYRSAPADPSPPYAVFDWRELSQEDDCVSGVLSVSVLDYGADRSTAEDAADAVSAALDHYQYLSGGLLLRTFPGSRKPELETDKDTVKISLEFPAVLYGRT